MRKLLQEIAVIPGVTGSCIFDKKEGPLCKDLHQDLSERNVQAVGIHLVRLLQMGAMAGLAISSSHFRFDRYTVIGIPLDSDSILMTICDAQANCSLVATTAAMLAADMRDDLKRDPSSTMTTKTPQEDGAESKEEDDAFIQVLLDEVEQALAGAIGPVAAVVMQDYLVRWRQAGPGTSARVPELAEMLLQEIGNPELAQKFSEKIKSIL
ncbi:MAG TPA: hypothetical protein ENK84_01330 [Desulfobulbus sp.]|nr:hypothetical protein [Desulfobulbus sp.]